MAGLKNEVAAGRGSAAFFFIVMPLDEGNKRGGD